MSDWTHYSCWPHSSGPVVQISPWAWGAFDAFDLSVWSCYKEFFMKISREHTEHPDLKNPTANQSMGGKVTPQCSHCIDPISLQVKRKRKTLISPMFLNVLFSPMYI